MSDRVAKLVDEHLAALEKATIDQRRDLALKFVDDAEQLREELAGSEDPHDWKLAERLQSHAEEAQNFLRRHSEAEKVDRTPISTVTFETSYQGPDITNS